MADFHVDVVSWLPAFLLACFFGFCESKEFSDRELTEPGVIVGIIVGVVGVLVVVGVSILLCRLFCCKETTCCSCCCKGEERYLEAGTVPIKIPSQESTPDNQSISTVSHNHPYGARRLQDARRAELDSSTPKPVQYDDDNSPQVHWKLTDLLKKKDHERNSKDSLSSAGRSENSAVQGDGREIPDILSESGAKRSGKTSVRRKLQLGADDNAEVSSNSDFAPSEHAERSKKRNVDAPRRGREFPVMGLKHRKKRHAQSSAEDGDEITAKEGNSSEASDAREFPLLEFEPGKRRSQYNPDHAPRTWEETRDGNDGEFSPMEFDCEPQAVQRPYPAPRSRMERNPDKAATGHEVAREFPLLKFGAEKRSFNPSYAPRTVVDETRDGEDWEFRPVEFDREPESVELYQPRSMQPYQPQSMQPHQPQSMQPYQPQPIQQHHPQSTQPPSYRPDYRSRPQWEEGQRRPRDHREPSTSPRGPVSLDNSSVSVSGTAHFSLGRENLAFNQDSTETTV